MVILCSRDKRKNCEEIFQILLHDKGTPKYLDIFTNLPNTVSPSYKGFFLVVSQNFNQTTVPNNTCPIFTK